MNIGQKRPILVLGDGTEGKGTLSEAILMKKYGPDVVIITPEEARAQGLGVEDFANVPTMTITSAPTLHLPVLPSSLKCGKARRRERRAQERRAGNGRGR